MLLGLPARLDGPAWDWGLMGILPLELDGIRWVSGIVLDKKGVTGEWLSHV